MNFFRQPIFYALLAIAIIVTIAISIVSNRKASTPTTTTTNTTTQVSNLTNMDPTDFDSSTKNEYALAASKATVANSGNKIALIEVNLDKDMLPTNVSTRYAFVAPTDANNNWVITITGGNFIRALIPKEDYLGSLTAFDTKLWKYNYVTALKLAEKNGGLTWRENNTLLAVKLTLRNVGTTSQLAWNIQYLSSDANFTVKFDANSGKLLDS